MYPYKLNKYYDDKNQKSYQNRVQVLAVLVRLEYVRYGDVWLEILLSSKDSKYFQVIVTLFLVASSFDEAPASRAPPTPCTGRKGKYE